MISNKLLPVALSLLLAPSVQAQSRIFVNAAATGAHTGTSWASAFNDLNDALIAASGGDSIFVAKGTYKPGMALGSASDPRDKTFILKDQVVLYGGFAGTETALKDRNESMITVNATILSGDIGVSGDSLDNSYHVMTGYNLSSKTIVDGVTIRDGNANSASVNVAGPLSIPRDFGGGVYLFKSEVQYNIVRILNNSALSGGAGIDNNNSPITLSNALISRNTINGADPDNGGGAGMRNSNSNVSLDNVTFSLNIARHTQGGGALRNEGSSGIFTNCSFEKNHAEDGDGGGAIYNAAGSNAIYNGPYLEKNTTTNQAGGMYNDNSSPVLNGAYFYMNSGEEGTGAMENDGNSNAVLNDAYFERNSTPGNGGAIQNWKSSPVMNRVYFESNTAGKDGGAVYNYNNCSPVLNNCFFYYNRADSNGGAFYNRRNSNPVLTNIIMARNAAGLNGGGIYNIAHTPSGSEPCSPVLTNVSIANNTATNAGGGGFDDGFGSSLLRNSIVNGNTVSGSGEAEIDAPPAMIATALFHTILGDLYFETGLTPPSLITGDLFLDTLGDDHRLAPMSAAIDKGDNAVFASGAVPDLSSIVLDIRGADRIMGTSVDLGAVEVCSDTIKAAISFTTSPGTMVSPGTLVTFTATAVNAGLDPGYQWNKNGVPVPGASEATYTASAGTGFFSADKITVTVFPDVDDACASDDSVWSKEVMMMITMSIDDAEHITSGLNIYPNPNNGDFIIETKGFQGKSYTLNILDLTGRSVYTESAIADKNNKALKLEGQLPSGTYLLSIESKDAPRQVKRFVIR